MKRTPLCGLLALTLLACSERPAPTASAPAGTEPASPETSLLTPLIPGAGSDAPPASDFGTAKPLSERHKATVQYRNGKLVADNSPPVIELQSEFENYVGGKLNVPAYPGDVLYMAATVQTEAGHPLKDQAVQVESARGNAAVLMADRTDAEGYIEFHVLVTARGEDHVKVRAAGIKREFLIDTRAPKRSEWLEGLPMAGVTPWDDLLQANVSLGRQQVAALFPPQIAKLNNQSIRLAGFMLPLESTARQKHFLLSANPPACFFHPPGGPASVVEVFAERAIATSFDPLMIEGRLELVTQSAEGILYRLHGARAVSP